MTTALESADTALLHKISCKASANLLVRQAGKIVCMEMLGNIVAKLRTANNWSLQELAERINAAGAPSVKYQNIQQLEAKPDTSPRYIVELAAAFQKSVEELRQWTPGKPIYGPQRPNTTANTGVLESPPTYDAPLRISDVELALIEKYRRCTAEIQQAIQTIAASNARHVRTRRSLDD